MGIVLRKKLSVFKTEILLILCITLIFTQKAEINFNFRGSTEQRGGGGTIETDMTNRKISSQVPTNDTTPPAITFIQPTNTYTLVVNQFYFIIVNITDDNPPVEGDVIIQVSNKFFFLFNASMALVGDSVWSFNWMNLTSYHNQENYTINVWAKDSSSNGNSKWSEEYSIFISIKSPQILQFVFYIFVVTLIFGGILLYLNRNTLFKSRVRKKKKKERNN